MKLSEGLREGESVYEAERGGDERLATREDRPDRVGGGDDDGDRDERLDRLLRNR